MRKFSADKVSINKREVRERLYQDLQELGVLKVSPRIGMLAGAVPAEEIGCIRRRFYRAQITAFDLEQSAVDAAATEYGVEAVQGNLRYKKTIGDHEFDFFNLDLCRTLVTERDVIQKVAVRAGKALAVFLSYRNDVTAAKTTTHVERVRLQKATIARERVTRKETTKNVERVRHVETTDVEERVTIKKTTTGPEQVITNETTDVEERVDQVESPKLYERLTRAQQLRVRLILDCVREVRPEAKIRRVYAYRGAATMMLGVLFVFRRSPVEQLPSFATTCEEATVERKVQLQNLGLHGKRLQKRLKSGMKELRRKNIS